METNMLPEKIHFGSWGYSYEVTIEKHPFETNYKGIIKIWVVVQKLCVV